MGENFSEQFWSLISGVLTLSLSSFTDFMSSTHSPWIAPIILFIAGLSGGIGQSIVLFVNRVKPFRFVLSLITAALIFVATYLVWVASTWLVVQYVFGVEVQISALATVLAVGYAPNILGFLVALPYFGMPIFVLLSIWTLLAILVGLGAVTDLALWEAAIAAGGGWVILQLGLRTVGRPLTGLARWLRTKSAGHSLITDWDELDDLLDAASYPLESSDRTWAIAEASDEILPEETTSHQLYRLIVIAFLAFVVFGFFATSQLETALWLQAMNRTVKLFLSLGIITLMAIGTAILLTPLDSLSWWAGWQKEKPLNPGVAVRKPQQDTQVVRYITYLDGINQGTYGYLPEVERFLDELAASLPPNMLLVKGIIPYSVSNSPLTTENPFAWAWRVVDNFKSQVPKIPIGFVVNLRNVFSVMVSTDSRYGPIQNRGLAQVLYNSLIYHGYPLGSGIPITLIGFSGGGQMSMGSVRYLQQATGAPTEVISIAGVISGNTGAMQAKHVYHLVGDKDSVAKIGNIFFPSRWPVAVLSNWNMARRRGRILFVSLGDVGHCGDAGPMGITSRLPDGRSHLQQTLDIVTGIVLQDWARTGLDRADFVRPSNYELYQAAPFNLTHYYPVEQYLDPTLYHPLGQWLGRLILPEMDERQAIRFVRIEIYHAPQAHAHLIGRTVTLQWSHDSDVQSYVQLVTMDVHFAEQVQISKRQGFVHPDRINHWSKVDPLESIAGSHPIDDVTVLLPDPIEVVETPDGQVTLLITKDPVHVTGRYYGLVQILESVGDDRVRVRHYRRASRQFDGPEETVYIPTVLPNRDNIYQSSNRHLERSPLNAQGWYIFGAQNANREFVVQAMAPYHLFDLSADQVITGSKNTLNYIKSDYWKDARSQKGTVTTALLLPQVSNQVPNPPTPEQVWKEGDRALLMEVYGGIGGNKKEFAPGGIYFGHFSFGIARVIREPLTGKLRFDIEYRQIFTHSPEAVIAGSNGWTRFMGDRQYGRIGFRPVADVIIKFPPFTQDYDFDGVTFSPMNRLIRELDVMAARYRIGDGTGTTSVSPVNSCVQDSTQALLTALNRLMAEFTVNPLMLKWLREHPDHEQTQRFWLLLDLLKSLESNLLPLGFARSDWRTGELTLGRFAGETPMKTLFDTLASWHSLLPRLANDIMAMIFLQLGASIWVIRASQVGGEDPDIEPIAPTDFGMHVPTIKKAKFKL